MGGRLSGNQVRVRLAQRDEPVKVSNAQLKAWRDWELLAQDAGGLWEADSVDKIVRIYELGKTLDAIPRRVIVLNAEPLFQVPSETLRQAMLAVAPKIRPHLQKMKRIAEAVDAIPSETGGAPRGTRRKPSPANSLPRKEEWEAVLAEATPEEFAARSGLQYYVANLLRELGRGSGTDVSDIPFDELIVLLTVRDLYWRRELRRQKSPDQTGVTA